MFQYLIWNTIIVLCSHGLYNNVVLYEIRGRAGNQDVITRTSKIRDRSDHPFLVIRGWQQNTPSKLNKFIIKGGRHMIWHNYTKLTNGPCRWRFLYFWNVSDPTRGWRWWGLCQPWKRGCAIVWTLMSVDWNTMSILISCLQHTYVVCWCYFLLYRLKRSVLYRMYYRRSCSRSIREE